MSEATTLSEDMPPERDLENMRFRAQYGLGFTLEEERWLVGQVSLQQGLGKLPPRKVRCNHCNATGEVNSAWAREAVQGRVRRRCEPCSGSGYQELV